MSEQPAAEFNELNNYDRIRAWVLVELDFMIEQAKQRTGPSAQVSADIRVDGILADGYEETKDKDGRVTKWPKSKPTGGLILTVRLPRKDTTQ